MKLSAWLLQDVNKAGLRLSDESETPTFYQTLAGVTHCEYDMVHVVSGIFKMLLQSDQSMLISLDFTFSTATVFSAHAGSLETNYGSIV